MNNITLPGFDTAQVNYSVVGMEDNSTVIPDVNVSGDTPAGQHGDHHQDGYRDLHDEVALIEFIVVGLTQTIFCFIGFILNTVSSVVWWNEGARNVTIYLLRVLSIVDNIFLVCVLLFHSMPSIYIYLNVLPDHFQALMRAVPYTWPLLWTSKTLAVWCIVVMSVVRYNIVCSPLKTSVRFSTKRVTQYLAALFLLIILLKLPRWFEMCVTEQVNPYTNETVGIPNFTHLAHDKTYQIAYMSVFTMIITYLLPMAILLYCSIRLIGILKEADAYRKKLVVNSVQISHSVTKMLLTVIILFVICETPEFVYSVVYLIAMVDPVVSRSLLNSYHHIKILKAVSDLAFTVNSSCNFFIYYLMARKFRKLVKEIIFCRSRHQKRRRTLSTSTSTQRTMSVSFNSSLGNISVVAESPMPPRRPSEQEKLDTEFRERQSTNKESVPQTKETSSRNSLLEDNGVIHSVLQPPLIRINDAVEDLSGSGELENHVNERKVQVEMTNIYANAKN